ncbi:glycosyltransferase family 4 protein [Desulfonauticus submarinus]
MSQQKPCIALYLPRFSIYGGVERFAYNLAAYLNKNNFKVIFICARKEISPPPNVKIICTGRPPLSKIGKMSWYAFFAQKIKNQIHADIHFSLGKTLSQDIVRVGGGPLKIFWELSQKAYPGFEKKIKILRRKLSPANQLTFWLEKKQFTQAKKIICVSDHVKEWLLKAYPHIPLNKITVIYNLPDLNKFYPQPMLKTTFRKKYNLPLNKKIILTVATNFKLKGIEYLIKSLKYLPTNYCLAVAGKRNASSYLKLSKKLNLTKRVFFLGQVKEIECLYPACDLFVLNSFYDACSNALLEAMACGLTAISSIFNGSSVFLNGNNLINDPANPKHIANVIQNACFIPLKIPSNLNIGLKPYKQIIESLL